jgi:hypothetical protein
VPSSQGKAWPRQSPFFSATAASSWPLSSKPHSGRRRDNGSGATLCMAAMFLAFRPSVPTQFLSPPALRRQQKRGERKRCVWRSRPEVVGKREETRPKEGEKGRRVRPLLLREARRGKFSIQTYFDSLAHTNETFVFSQKNWVKGRRLRAAFG